MDSTCFPSDERNLKEGLSELMDVRSAWHRRGILNMGLRPAPSCLNLGPDSIIRHRYFAPLARRG